MLSLRDFWTIIMHLLNNRAEVLFVLLSAGAFTKQKMFSTRVFLFALAPASACISGFILESREIERERQFPLGRETWKQGTVNILSLSGNEAPLS